MTTHDLAADYARLRQSIPALEANLQRDPAIAARMATVENAKAMLRAALAELDAARQQHPLSATILAQQADLTRTATDLITSWNEKELGKTLLLTDGSKVQRKTTTTIEVKDAAAVARYLLDAKLWAPAVKSLVLEGEFCRPLCEKNSLPGATANLSYQLAYTAPKPAMAGVPA